MSNIGSENNKRIYQSIIESELEDHREIILRCRKKYRKENLPKSSAGSCPNKDTELIFYEGFLYYPITLEGNIKIFPNNWAKAFLQKDIQSIARVLCESIFTPTELEKRNAQKEEQNSCESNALPYYKKLAIARAAKWLMNKHQDPWNFKPSGLPTDKEKEEIDKVFDTFDKVDQTILNTSAEVEYDLEDKITEESLMDFASTTQSQNYNSFSVQSIYDELKDGCKFQTVFLRIMELSKNKVLKSLGHSAQAAKLLTKLTVPENTDVFVDAVPFSMSRFAKAIYKGDTAEKRADILFRIHHKLDFCDNKEFNSLDDLDPVKQLAIIRAVSWIEKLKELKISDCYSFDASIPNHNQFLPWPDIYRIYNYISTKYGSGPCRQESFVRDEQEILATTPSNSNFQEPSLISRSTCIVSPTPISSVSPKSKFSTFQESRTPPTIMAKENGDMTINGQTFSSTVWTEAYHKFGLEDGIEKAGKFLCEKMFTEEEISTCNLSGRGNKLKFSQAKIDAIIYGLEHMRGTISFTNSEKRELITKIFIEHPNYLRRRMQKGICQKEN